MPAEFVVGPFTIPPGEHVLWFSFSWAPGQHPNKGPVFCMWSPDHPAKPEEVKLQLMAMHKVALPRVRFRLGLISNSCSQPVKARLMGVYFPEFQADWEMQP